MAQEQQLLIRILPVCTKDALPRQWESALKNYVVEVMPVVEHPAAAALAVRSTEPDVLLVDGDIRGLDIVELSNQALKERSSLAIIVFSSVQSEDVLQKAMLAGVEEFLPKPLDAQALRETVASVAQRRDLREAEVQTESTQTQEDLGRVVGIFSAKGGLGKTTVATNLAALMAKSKERTLLVGMESGDGAILLDVQPKLGMYDMMGGVNGEQSGQEEQVFSPDWMKQYMTTHSSGLNYLSWDGVSTPGEQPVPPAFLPIFIRSARKAYKYTFIDFPILSNEEFTAVLAMLDVALVISSTCDLLALRSTKNLLDLVVPEYKRRVRVIVNRADSRDMIQKEDFEQALKYRMAARIPNFPEAAAQAINLGAPLSITHQKSELTHQYEKLAHQLFKLPLPEKAEKPAKRFGLF